MATPAPEASAADRFSFALFLAASLHLTLVLGLGFDFRDRAEAERSVAVTLAQHRTEAPQEADFRAQHNQKGGGRAEKAAVPTTTEPAPFEAQIIQRILPHPRMQPRRGSREQVVTSSSPQAPAASSSQAPNTAPTMSRDPRQALAELQRNLEIASLEARLDAQKRARTRDRGGAHRAPATRASADADYIRRWRAKVERVGNRNYPAAARRQGLYGELRLAVTLEADGSLAEVAVLDSSGHSLLDQAAKRILRLAAPFEPFPRALRERREQLRIVRTWKFEQGHYSSVP